MKPSINKKNVINFIEGNLKMLGDKINLLPFFIKEQIVWRSEICKEDCVKIGKCKYCGCSLPGKFYVTKSCNYNERFPDLIKDRKEWDLYKRKNNIKVEIKK